MGYAMQCALLAPPACHAMAVAWQDSENMRNSEALTNLKLALETFHAEQSAAADAQHALLQRELAAANVRRGAPPQRMLIDLARTSRHEHWPHT